MDKQNLSLGEVALTFLTSLSPEESKNKQQELNRFIQWYGKERPVGKITPLEIENYAGWITKSTGDATKKLEPVKDFLTYVKKEKLVKATLATHLRIKKTDSKTRLRAKARQEIILTPEDYDKLKAQLATLQEDRFRVAEDLHRAALDKDFRENAPLQAAREERDQIESRIREIQTALASGVLVQEEEEEERPKEVTVKLGSKVIIRDVASGVQLTYTLATKNNANPAKSKISIVSPIGKALLKQRKGAVVKVLAPIGELRYKIESIE